MPELGIIFLALAVSLDGFGVGMACGIKRLHIMMSSLLVICFMSAGAVGASMLLGQLLGVFISPELAPKGGGTILLLMGLHFTYQAIKDFKKPASKSKAGQHVVTENNSEVEEVSSGQGCLKVIFNMAREPASADRDRSGTLSAGEAFGLGVALAADAFGAGFGAVLVGLHPIFTVAAVGATKFLLVPAGVLVGRSFSFSFLGNFAPLLSGFILILLGVWSFV